MTASNGKSFKCDQEQDITLQGNVKVTVAIKKMQLQPFKSDENAVFGEGNVHSVKVAPLLFQAHLSMTNFRP